MDRRQEKKNKSVHSSFHFRFLVTLQQYPQVNEGRQCRIHVYNLRHNGTEVYNGEGFLKDIMFVIPNSTNILAIQTAAASSKEAFENNLDNTVLIDVTRGEIVATNKCHPSLSLHFSSDGTRGIDRTLRVFDFTSGTILRDLHQELEDKGKVPKYRSKISRDGQFAVWVTEQDGMLKVADIQSGQLIGKALVHALPQSLEVSENNIVAVGCDDGRIMLLQIWQPAKSGRAALFKERCSELLQKHLKTANKIIRPQRLQRSACCMAI